MKNWSTTVKCVLLLSILFFHSCTNQMNGPEEGMTLLPSSKTGITFSNNIEENYDRNIWNFNYIYNGGGVAIGDINNDGLSDIYFTGNMVPDKLYLNKGDFKFEDITESSLIDGVSGWHSGVTMVDINHDEYLDIYICRGGYEEPRKLMTNELWINQKDGTFKEESKYYKLNDPGYSICANFFDGDNDGDLDVYVGNRREKWILSNEEHLKMEPDNDDHSKDKYFVNNGNFSFRYAEDLGIYDPFNFPLSVTTADLNIDGHQDIYVASDYLYEDYFFLNQGDGRFKNALHSNFKHSAFYAMGTDIADIDNDGDEDIFTTEMLPSDYWRAKVTMAPMMGNDFFEFIFGQKGVHYQYMHNVLQINNGLGQFSEVSQLAGLQHTDWSWACLMADFNNDSHRDLFVANGYKRDVFDNDAMKEVDTRSEVVMKLPKDKRPPIDTLLKLLPSNKLSNYMFMNQGNLKFEEVQEAWGMNQKSFSNGAAYGDLDNDGDLDLVVNNVDHEAFVYRNNSSENNFLRIKLKGSGKNTFGIGSWIKVHTPSGILTEQFKVVKGYLSSVEPIAHFGLGKETKIDKVEVIWPNHALSTITDVEINQVLEINQSEAKEKYNFKSATDKRLMVENNQAIIPSFKHEENKFDDFEVQILLPHKQSANGPFIAHGDINGDGLEDFFIGGAHQQSGAIFIQDNQGHFSKISNPALDDDAIFEDMGAELFDYDNDGDLDLYVVSGGAEFVSNASAYQDRIYANDGKGNFSKLDILPEIAISGSCVKAADFDNDGDLDLFVGGRILPTFYPYPTNSFLLENTGEKFEDVTLLKAPSLNQIGLVTDAEWVDVNNDDALDLVVVGEWMPITVLLNEKGSLTNKTKDLGLNKTAGWYFNIEAADLNKDGKKELIAGNLGLNYKFHASQEKPFHIYSNDFDGNGTYDVFLAKYYKDKQVPVRGRQCSSEQVPEISKKFPTYRAFAESDISTILGEKYDDALHLEAYNFESVVLSLNDTSFEMHPLPIEAQFSTARGMVIEDIDGDGNVDIVVGGNMYQSEPETTRADASMGVVLKGNGQLDGFVSLQVGQSGLYIPYDVRDLALIKNNAASSLLVATNNDTLRLFQIN